MCFHVLKPWLLHGCFQIHISSTRNWCIVDSIHFSERSGCISLFHWLFEKRGLIPKFCVWRAFLIMTAYQGSPLCSELKLPCSPPSAHTQYNTAQDTRVKLSVNFHYCWLTQSSSPTADTLINFPLYNMSCLPHSCNCLCPVFTRYVHYCIYINLAHLPIYWKMPNTCFFFKKYLVNYSTFWWCWANSNTCRYSGIFYCHGARWYFRTEVRFLGYCGGSHNEGQTWHLCLLINESLEFRMKPLLGHHSLGACFIYFKGEI